jgi:hypothetical protein
VCTLWRQVHRLQAVRSHLPSTSYHY